MKPEAKHFLNVLEKEDRLNFVFSSDFKYIDTVCEKTMKYLDAKLGKIEEQKFAVNLVIREGLTNAVRHGNRSNPEKMVRFSIEIVNKGCIKLVIEDEGEGFDWRRQKEACFGEEDEHGRGVAIMAAYFNRYRYNEKGNILYLEKDISSA